MLTIPKTLGHFKRIYASFISFAIIIIQFLSIEENLKDQKVDGVKLHRSVIKLITIHIELKYVRYIDNE